MGQTITISAKTITTIQARLDKLTKEVKAIKARLLEEEPPYGSKDWWDWSDKKAQEDIKAGRYVKFDSVEEAVKWLNS